MNGPVDLIRRAVQSAVDNVDLASVARRNSSTPMSATRQAPIRKYNYDRGPEVITDTRSQYDQVQARTNARVKRAEAKEARAEARAAGMGSRREPTEYQSVERYQEENANLLRKEPLEPGVYHPIPSDFDVTGLPHVITDLQVRGTVTSPDIAQRVAAIEGAANPENLLLQPTNEEFLKRTLVREGENIPDAYKSGNLVVRDRGVNEEEARLLYNEQFESMKLGEAPLAPSNLGFPEEEIKFLSRVNPLLAEAEETGSVVGLLRRQNMLYDQSSGIPAANTNEGLEYALLGDQISRMERASLSGPGGYGPIAPGRSQESARRLYSQEAYDEAVHARANLNTATEAMEGVTTGTPVASGGTGVFNPVPTESSTRLLDSINNAGMGGIAAAAGIGAVLGGTANYAMGGEFSEGAMMGGLAGGGITIGARAIGANSAQISNYMQRQVLGTAYEEGAGAANAAAVRNLTDDQISRLGFGQRQAYNQLMRNPDSPRMQARHAVIGGSMLAGVAFTGRRNDKRRGFNAHRGNRI